MPTIQERVDAAYGAGEYKIEERTEGGTKRLVMATCPEHSWFITTADNLIYNAGCKKCRGVNPRGYPIRRREEIAAKRGRPPLVYSLYVRSVDDSRIEVDLLPSDPTWPCLYVSQFHDRALAYAALGLIRKGFEMRRDNLAGIVELIEAIPARRV